PAPSPGTVLVALGPTDALPRPRFKWGDEDEPPGLAHRWFEIIRAVGSKVAHGHAASHLDPPAADVRLLDDRGPSLHQDPPLGRIFLVDTEVGPAVAL